MRGPTTQPIFVVKLWTKSISSLNEPMRLDLEKFMLRSKTIKMVKNKCIIAKVAMGSRNNKYH